MLDGLFLKIHQNVRIRVVGARTKSARLLAGIGVAITPPSQKPLLESAAIVWPEHNQRLDDQMDGLVPSVLLLQFRHKRQIAIVVMNFIDSHDPLAQIVVAVHDGQIGTNS